MCERQLVTVPLPGDVACFLSRLGHTRVLNESEVQAVAPHLHSSLVQAAAGADVTGAHLSLHMLVHRTPMFSAVHEQPHCIFHCSTKSAAYVHAVVTLLPTRLCPVQVLRFAVPLD